MDTWSSYRAISNSKDSIPETTVIGPLMFTTFCRVKFLTRHRNSVDFPTLGGPIIAINTGGGSAGTLSTTGIWCFFSFTSRVLYTIHNTTQYSAHHFCTQLIFYISWTMSTIPKQHSNNWSFTATICHFYSMKPSGARYCHGKLSVRLWRWGIVTGKLQILQFTSGAACNKSALEFDFVCKVAKLWKY